MHVRVGGATVLDKELAYPIAAEADPDLVDWQVTHHHSASLI